MGSGTLLIAIAILFHLLSFTAFLWVSTTLTAIHLFPQYRLSLFSISSLGYWYFSDLILAAMNLPAFQDNYLIYRILLPTFLLLFYFIYSYAFLKIKKSLRLIFLFLTLIPIIALLLEKAQDYTFALFLAMSIKSYIFWIAALFNKEILNKKDSFLTIANILPFYGTQLFSPITDSQLSCSVFAPIDRNTLTKTQLTGLRLLFFSILAIFSVKIIDYVIFNEKNLSLQFSTFFASITLPTTKINFIDEQEKYPWWLQWIRLTGIYFQFYLGLAYTFGVPVAIGRLVGLPFPAMFNSPWKAKSFAEFNGRFLHYYSYLLMNVFFPFFRNILSPLRNAYIKTYAALWLSVFGGGIIYHFINDLFLSLGKNNTLFFTLSTSIQNMWLYFSILATAICVSFYLRSFYFNFRLNFLRFPLYIVIGTFIFNIFVYFHDPISSNLVRNQLDDSAKLCGKYAQMTVCPNKKWSEDLGICILENRDKLHPNCDFIFLRYSTVFEKCNFDAEKFCQKSSSKTDSELIQCLSSKLNLVSSECRDAFYQIYTTD